MKKLTTKQTKTDQKRKLIILFPAATKEKNSGEPEPFARNGIKSLLAFFFKFADGDAVGF